MQVLSKLVALASVASATYNGFNYGSTNTDGSAVTLEQFTNLFTTAQALPNTNGEFSAARLYTMIQAGTTNGVISAIPAAINTNTHLLLGLWASAGQADFDNELAALSAAITQYGSAFTNLIAGISVGSEDLTVSRLPVFRTFRVLVPILLLLSTTSVRFELCSPTPR